MASSSAARHELRESWESGSVRVWARPDEPWRRWLWRGTVALLPLGVGPAIIALLVTISSPGNIGYIWLLGATSYTGLLALTVSLAVRFEPRDVRFEITREHIGLDDEQVAVEDIDSVRWTGRQLILRTIDGLDHASRPAHLDDPDRLVRLIEGALPPRPDRPQGTLIPFLARR